MLIKATKAKEKSFYNAKANLIRDWGEIAIASSKNKIINKKQIIVEVKYVLLIITLLLKQNIILALLYTKHKLRKSIYDYL